MSCVHYSLGGTSTLQYTNITIPQDHSQNPLEHGSDSRVCPPPAPFGVGRMFRDEIHARVKINTCGWALVRWRDSGRTFLQWPESLRRPARRCSRRRGSVADPCSRKLIRTISLLKAHQIPATTPLWNVRHGRLPAGTHPKASRPSPIESPWAQNYLDFSICRRTSRSIIRSGRSRARRLMRPHLDPPDSNCEAAVRSALCRWPGPPCSRRFPGGWVIVAEYRWSPRARISMRRRDQLSGVQAVPGVNRHRQRGHGRSAANPASQSSLWYSANSLPTARAPAPPVGISQTFRPAQHIA